MAEVQVERKESTVKPGRTLRLRVANLQPSNPGLVSRFEGNGVTFLEYDTVEHALETYNELKTEKKAPRYAYYKVFFRFTQNELTYDQFKDKLIEKLGTDYSDLSVLYFKLYMNSERNLLGSGHLVVDRKSDLDRLIQQSKMDLDTIGVTFYQFRNQNYRNTKFTRKV